MGNKLKALYKEAYGNWSVAYLSVWTGFMCSDSPPRR